MIEVLLFVRIRKPKAAAVKARPTIIRPGRSLSRVQPRPTTTAIIATSPATFFCEW
ncbi:hypothetical protein FMGBMHLM_3080 [Methylobacterium aerolatum]|nr:hypothetical protein FMGBMHLM_3080 [Methylobacterium aerolatum]